MKTTYFWLAPVLAGGPTLKLLKIIQAVVTSVVDTLDITRDARGFDSLGVFVNIVAAILLHAPCLEYFRLIDIRNSRWRGLG